jgi:hypothetical protein
VASFPETPDPPAHRDIVGRRVRAQGRVNDDYDAYLKIAPDIVAGLRLDPQDDLPHGDYLYVVEMALPLIEAARAAKA